MELNSCWRSCLFSLYKVSTVRCSWQSSMIHHKSTSKKIATNIAQCVCDKCIQKSFVQSNSKPHFLHCWSLADVPSRYNVIQLGIYIYRTNNSHSRRNLTTMSTIPTTMSTIPSWMSLLSNCLGHPSETLYTFHPSDIQTQAQAD